MFDPFKKKVRYAARILLVLLGLWPQVSISQNLNNPEALFIQAMKLAETDDRTGVSKRLDEACLLWTKRGDLERAGRARLQIGDLYRNDKRFNESLSQYRQTLLIEGLSPSLKALTYDAIGQIYAELYQTELSTRNYLKALNLARLNKDYAVEAQVQLNLASLSYREGDFGRAMDLAQRAVISSSKGNDEKAGALSLSLLAQMELKNGRFEKGHSNLDRALSLYKQNNDLPAQIKTLCFLSGLSLSARQVSLAREQAETALRMAEDMARRATTNSQKLRANTLRWPCWLALARAQRGSQERENALKSYFRAVSGTVLDWWMVYAATERSAIGFAEERQAAYRELVDLLVDLGRIDEAYDAYQYARIRTLSGFIRARRLVGSRSDTDTDNKISTLSASIIALRTRLLSPTLNRHQRENLQRDLVEAEDDLAERRLQAELNHPRRRLVFSRPARLTQLQNQLGDGESVIEFYLGEERSFVWLISRGTVGFEILSRRSEIEGKVRKYVNDLSTAPANLHLQLRVAKQQAMAQELFTMLFGKLASRLTDYKLIVIPDGLLNHVPYESLFNNGRYLLEDHQISYLPSASLIELLRQPPPRSASEHDDQLDLLAFGDPVFQQRSKTSLSRNLPATSAKAEKRAWDWEMSNLSRLPRTRDEVEYIASLIPKERQRLYLGKDSTEKAFKQEPLSKYKWIHLATHSLIDERNPGRSAVVLGLDGNNDEDGFLRATEIADLDLNCDLVILSACETGRGQLTSGEGIIGLSRSFFVAGARSVVVSQWAVSDISTAQLMKDFYQQMVSDVAKPAALREAKLRMLGSGSETRHPYYWAPFVIIGIP
ncbi:MAG TPA: CHAT domain-containing tetratricopeptide repeat protein [Pyrinomonadaceae bacterium]|nr:CHAT domain-containing tetratricopeptide repeat protein [Pyrinomonadaceae bacterium]